MSFAGRTGEEGIRFAGTVMLAADNDFHALGLTRRIPTSALIVSSRSLAERSNVEALFAHAFAASDGIRQNDLQWAGLAL